MSDILHFCPKCNSLFEFVQDDGKLKHRCSVCKHIEEFKSEDPTIKMTYTSSTTSRHYSRPTFATRFDSSLSKTTQLECTNDGCPTKTSFNKGIIPVVQLLNHPDINRRQQLVCVACGHTGYVGIASST